MFFWILLPIVLVVFVCAVVYGVRGYGERVHEPGTRHLYPEDTQRSTHAADDARRVTPDE